MNKVYDRPTLNMSAIGVGANATEVLTEILVSMKKAVGDLLADKTYIAIQSGILAGTPEDFGVVRYSAHLKKDYKVILTGLNYQKQISQITLNTLTHTCCSNLDQLPALCHLCNCEYT